MKLLQFLGDFEKKCSLVSDFWQLERHDIPPSQGVYLLIAKPDIEFQYPKGKSPVYYIGKAKDLRDRLGDHFTHHSQVRDGNLIKSRGPLYGMRHEYGGMLGGRYCYIKTWRGMTRKNLEDIVLARFAKKYHAFPVTNSAGAWNRIEKEFKN